MLISVRSSRRGGGGDPAGGEGRWWRSVVPGSQSVKCLTPGFNSGLDLRVMRLRPMLGSVLSKESA